MKKTRTFQSLIMLLACVALLTVGIYAISPSQNNVTGTITVIASNVEVEITAYLGANKATATKVSDTVTARTSTPVPIYDDKLEFDGSNVAGSDAVADMTLLLEIKNNSASKSLGAFFLKDATLPETLTRANITTSMSFDGKTEDGKNTSAGLVTFALQDYTEIGAGQTVDLICTLSLNSLTDYDMLVDFSLPLVIHDYNETLVRETGSVTVSTESDKSVEIQTVVGDSSYNNGVISSTTKLKKGLSDVEFTTQSTDPIEVTLSITNKTTTELGVYFLDSSVSESVAFDSNGLVTADGIMVKTQITQNGNVVDVYLSTYSYLAVSGDANDCDSIEMYIAFYPTTIVSDCSVMFDFSLNIEEYVSNMDTGDLVTSVWGSDNGQAYECVQSIPSSLIKISSNVTSLSNYVFAHADYTYGWFYMGRPLEWGDMSTKYIVIPSSVTSIGSHCFIGNGDLIGISISGNTSSSVGFRGCTSLLDVRLPKNTTEMSGTIFMDCSNLKQITIPGTVTAFDSASDSPLSGCTSLTRIVIKQGSSDIIYNAEFPTISGKTWYLNGVAVTTNKLARSAACDNVYVCK